MGMAVTPADDSSHATRLLSAFGEATALLAPVMMLSGKETGGWLHANVRFVDYTGLDPENAANRSWRHFLREDAAERVRLLLLHLPQDGNPSGELRVSMLSRSGTYRRCALRAYRSPTFADHWFVAISDIDRDHWHARRVAHLRESLKQSLAERECLVRQLLEAQEEERSRIAADLHDRLGQSLTALKLALYSGKQVHSGDAENLAMLRLLEETERELDRVTVSLRPYFLEVEGIRNGLQSFLEDWSAQSGIDFEFECTDDFPTSVPAHLEIGLYRLVVASLANVAKHSQAHHVSVVLGRTRGILYAIVEDNGIGFSVPNVLHRPGARRRSGTVIMEHRARQLSGSCTWESAPGKGTAVYIRIPFDAAADESALSKSHC